MRKLNTMHKAPPAIMALSQFKEALRKQWLLQKRLRLHATTPFASFPPQWKPAATPLPAAATSSASARMLTFNGTSRWLAAVLFGELIIWDFPCSVFIRKLQDPVLRIEDARLLLGGGAEVALHAEGEVAE